jgi:hypothetical protein
MNKEQMNLNIQKQMQTYFHCLRMKLEEHHLKCNRFRNYLLNVL